MTEQATPTPSVEVTIGGATYALRYTMAATNRIEGTYKKTVLQLVNELAQMSTMALTALVWGGIVHDPRAKALTPSQVAEKIDLRQFGDLAKAITEAVLAAYGLQTEAEGDGAGKADGES
jgi:hypothetical protein